MFREHLLGCKQPQKQIATKSKRVNKMKALKRTVVTGYVNERVKFFAVAKRLNDFGMKAFARWVHNGDDALSCSTSK